MDTLFKVHKLNAEGLAKARKLAEAFDALLDEIHRVSETGTSEPTRELYLVRTYLELACFYAKKNMAMDIRNQEV
jgi:hypothetical protein